jgi:hypothetical protein
MQPQRHPLQGQNSHTVGFLARQMANPSVKGTSRKRAAPYVER